MNEFCNKVFSGDVRASARLMRLVDDRAEGYEEYMKEWTPQNHEKLWGEMEHLFQKMDEWRPDVFYRRPESMEQSD